jgi:hypothetical protein
VLSLNDISRQSSQLFMLWLTTTYPPPKRQALAVDEELTVRGKEKPIAKSAAPARAESPVKLAPLPPKVAHNPLLWSKEIRIDWGSDNSEKPKTYTPHSDLEDLDQLVFAYENKEPEARCTRFNW